MTQPAADASKQEWRTWAKEERASVDFGRVSGAVTAAIEAWPPYRSARTVLVFFALEDEIDLTPLLDVPHGHRFVATHTPDRRGRLTVHELGGPLQVHRLGFLQPHPASPAVDPGDIDLLLLPGLAFDLYGNRLGRGGGYFDELLSRVHRDALLVGVTPTRLIVDRLPSDEDDIPVRYLATEEGVVETAGRPGAR